MLEKIGEISGKMLISLSSIDQVPIMLALAEITDLCFPASSGERVLIQYGGSHEARLKKLSTVDIRYLDCPLSRLPAISNTLYFEPVFVSLAFAIGLPIEKTFAISTARYFEYSLC